MSTLAKIRLKVRKLVKMPSVNQLTNAELDESINTFYVDDLPAELKLLSLKQTYTFITESGVDVYDFAPDEYINIEPPIYVGGVEMDLYQSKASFFYNYPNIAYNQTLTTGTGASGVYSGTITAVPVRKDNVLISTVSATGVALSAQDDGAGNLVGDLVAGATVDYDTGVISGVTWNLAISAGEKIKVQFINYQAGKPRAVLFFNNKFQLTPVPDQAYKIEMDAYKMPTELLNASDTPVIGGWWQLIAYGAAGKIFADNLDMESFEKVNHFFEKQKMLVLRRTLQQLKLNRASTIYSGNQKCNNFFSSGS